jgi:hypothetical protein
MYEMDSCGISNRALNVRHMSQKAAMELTVIIASNCLVEGGQLFRGKVTNGFIAYLEYLL